MTLVRTLLLIMLGLLAALPARAVDKDQADRDAYAALVLAKAKARQPQVAAQTRTIPYEEAAKLSLKSKQPIFLTVNLGCAGLCNALRPQFITCHEPKLEGSAKPRAILLVPGNDGNLWRVKVWEALPSEKEVKEAAEQYKKIMVEPAGDGADLLMAALVSGMIAVQPAEFEFTQAGTVTICDPINGCREYSQALAPRPRYAMMPLAGGGMTVSAAAISQGVVVAEGDGSQFVAKFPRLAKFRGRVRGAMGLPPPQVAVGFLSFPAPAAAAPVPPASNQAPAIVQGAAGPVDFIQVGPHRVPHALIKRAHAAGMNLPQIIDFIIKYGIPFLQELLNALGK